MPPLLDANSELLAFDRVKVDTYLDHICANLEKSLLSESKIVLIRKVLIEVVENGAPAPRRLLPFLGANLPTGAFFQIIGAVGYPHRKRLIVE